MVAAFPATPTSALAEETVAQKVLELGEASDGALFVSRIRVLQPNGNPHTEHHWGPLRQAWLSRRGQIWLASAEGKPPTLLFGGERVWNLQVEPSKRRIEAIATIREEPVHALCVLWPNARHSRKRYMAACDATTRDQWVTAMKSRNVQAVHDCGSLSARNLAALGTMKLLTNEDTSPRTSLQADATSSAGDPEEKSLEVRVNGLSGPLCKVEAKICWTLLDIKAEVSRITGIPRLQQRLLLDAQEMQDSTVLSTLPSRQSGLDLLLLRRSAEQVFWLERLKHDGQALFAAPESIRADREAVLAAVRSHGDALRCAEPRLQADREVVLEAVRRSGRALAWAEEELRNDREVVLEAVRAHPSALAHAAQKFCADRDVAMEVVTQDPSLFSCVEESLRADRDVVLAAVRRDGAVLEHAAVVLRADRGIVLEAVHSNGLAFEHAAPALRSDREIVVAAIERNPHLLALASPALQKDEQLIRISERRPLRP